GLLEDDAQKLSAADLNQGFVSSLEAEFELYVAHALAVDSHPALSHKPLRFGHRRREPLDGQQFHQSDRAGRLLDGRNITGRLMLAKHSIKLLVCLFCVVLRIEITDDAASEFDLQVAGMTIAALGRGLQVGN